MKEKTSKNKINIRELGLYFGGISMGLLLGHFYVVGTVESMSHSLTLLFYTGCLFGLFFFVLIVKSKRDNGTRREV